MQNFISTFATFSSSISKGALKKCNTFAGFWILFFAACSVVVNLEHGISWCWNIRVQTVQRLHYLLFLELEKSTKLGVPSSSSLICPPESVRNICFEGLYTVILWLSLNHTHSCDQVVCLKMYNKTWDCGKIIKTGKYLLWNQQCVFFSKNQLFVETIHFRDYNSSL